MVPERRNFNETGASPVRLNGIHVTNPMSLYVMFLRIPDGGIRCLGGNRDKLDPTKGHLSQNIRSGFVTAYVLALIRSADYSQLYKRNGEAPRNETQSQRCQML